MAKSKGTHQQQPQVQATQTTSQDPTGAAQSAAADPRQEAIAQAAYYKAEQRGFAPGYEMQDWLDAEREVASAEAKQ